MAQEQKARCTWSQSVAFKKPYLDSYKSISVFRSTSGGGKDSRWVPIQSREFHILFNEYGSTGVAFTVSTMLSWVRVYDPCKLNTNFFKEHAILNMFGMADFERELKQKLEQKSKNS